MAPQGKSKPSLSHPYQRGVPGMGAAPPGAQYIQVTPEEKAAIDRVILSRVFSCFQA